MGANSPSSFFLTHDSICTLISGWSSWFALVSADGQLGGLQLFLLQTALWTASSYSWIWKWNLWCTEFVHLEFWPILPHCFQKRLSSFTWFFCTYSVNAVEIVPDSWYNYSCDPARHSPQGNSITLWRETSAYLKPYWLGGWRPHFPCRGNDVSHEE